MRGLRGEHLETSKSPAGMHPAASGNVRWNRKALTIHLNNFCVKGNAFIRSRLRRTYESGCLGRQSIEQSSWRGSRFCLQAVRDRTLTTEWSICEITITFGFYIREHRTSTSGCPDTPNLQRTTTQRICRTFFIRLSLADLSLNISKLTHNQ